MDSTALVALEPARQRQLSARTAQSTKELSCLFKKDIVLLCLGDPAHSVNIP